MPSRHEKDPVRKTVNAVSRTDRTEIAHGNKKTSLTLGAREVPFVVVEAGKIDSRSRLNFLKKINDRRVYRTVKIRQHVKGYHIPCF